MSKESNRLWMQIKRKHEQVFHRSERLKKQGKCTRCEMLLSSKFHSCPQSKPQEIRQEVKPHA